MPDAWNDAAIVQEFAVRCRCVWAIRPDCNAICPAIYSVFLWILNRINMLDLGISFALKTTELNTSRRFEMAGIGFLRCGDADHG